MDTNKMKQVGIGKNNKQQHISMYIAILLYFVVL